MDIVIFDIEATCDTNNEDIIMETIEIGAVKLNSNLEIIDTFEVMIKPSYSHITEYCTDLTGITAKEIGLKGISHEKAIDKFREFLKDTEVAYSWGSFDKEQLILDCERHIVDCNFLSIHKDMKDRYRETIGVNQRRVGLRRAMNRLGVNFVGDRHRALPDALATAKVYISMIEKENEYVYCTDCVRFYHLLEAIKEDTDIPNNCKKCYPYDIEDSKPFKERKMFKKG